jgi:hypothetical protein
MAGPSILLIDDKVAVLDGLEGQLEGQLPPEVEVRRWMPAADGDDPEQTFAALVDAETVLVATDYDLTGNGLKGLFGLTIVGWCQTRSIPVGDFSRGHTHDLPDEPNLFELRVPPDDVAGARYIAAAVEGFMKIRAAFAGNASLVEPGQNLATILATILDRPHLDSQFALYMTRLGSANSSLVQRLTDFAEPDAAPSDQDKVQVLTYVLGHVLLNAILKFPGPILSEQALCAYVATSFDECQVLVPLFERAVYAGPFALGARRYWREDVDEIIFGLAGDLGESQFAGFGDFNRAVVEGALGRELAAHACDRTGCGGKKGGFLCPFTNRPVCERGDCSVPSSSWIPRGAQLSRVERDYYDEWAPLLGL